MNDDKIELAYKQLKQIGLCGSRSTFSREWLNREESYYRGIQAKGIKASVNAQLNLVSRLRQLGTSLSRSDHPKVAVRGMFYLKIYGECLDALLNRAQSDAMNSDCADKHSD